MLVKGGPRQRRKSNCRDLCLPPVGEELDDIPGVVIQALLLEGVIILLISQGLDETQQRGTQAAESVSDEGHEREALVGVDLVVVAALVESLVCMTPVVQVPTGWYQLTLMAGTCKCDK